MMVSTFLSLLATAAAALTSILEMLEKVSVQLMVKLDYCMLPGLPGGHQPPLVGSRHGAAISTTLICRTDQ